MATLDLTDVRPKDDLADVRPNGDYSAEDSLKMPAELWAPPLAPSGDEDAYLAPQPSRRMLIAGTAIVAALGVAVLAYFFLALAGAKPPGEIAETAPLASSSIGAASSSETQVQPAPTVAEPSRGGSGVMPSRDVPASLAAEPSPQVAASAATPQTSPAAQNQDVVFLQRPSVNIKSGPSGSSPVIGTAPKGTQFTATGREGDWVQVENTRLKGWISSQFLASDRPQ